MLLASSTAEAQTLEEIEAAELRRIRALTGVDFPELPAPASQDMLDADRTLFEQQPVPGVEEGSLPSLMAGRPR